MKTIENIFCLTPTPAKNQQSEEEISKEMIFIRNVWYKPTMEVEIMSTHNYNQFESIEWRTYAQAIFVGRKLPIFWDIIMVDTSAYNFKNYISVILQFKSR